MLRTGRIEYHSAGSSRERERRVIRHLRPHVRERDDAAVRAARGARDPADLASFVQQWRVVLGRLVEIEDSQPPVRVAAEAKTRDRLLARIAALREGDVAVVEPRLRRKNPVVELAPPARYGALDPAQLELVLPQRRVEAGIERLPCSRPVGCEADRTAE